MIKFEALEKLPETAVESYGSGKYRDILYELDKHKKDNAYFMKFVLTEEEDKMQNALAGLKTALKRDFGDLWDVLRDKHKLTLVYIRKNPYKGESKDDTA